MEPPKNHDSRIALGDGSDEPVDSSNYVTAIKIYSAYSAFKKQIRLARLVSMKDIEAGGFTCFARQSIGESGDQLPPV